MGCRVAQIRNAIAKLNWFLVQSRDIDPSNFQIQFFLTIIHVVALLSPLVLTYVIKQFVLYLRKKLKPVCLKLFLILF
jgi:hypothetical protein